MKYQKISFCTVCMNRLNHLRKTLPKNIEDNMYYSNVEFVLLDYSSSDGLSEWIKQEMQMYLDQGLLKYYQVENATYFNRSHSRNLAFQLSTGDIICNVDADNYLGKNFASYINEKLQDSESYLVADSQKKLYYFRDVVGRVALHKSSFQEVRGYCEEMQGYGFEDNDFYKRLQTIGKKQLLIDDVQFLKAIQHADSYRTENEEQSSEIHSFYIHYTSLNQSEVFLLYKNGKFQFLKLKPNQNQNPIHELEDNQWQEGKWKKINQKMIFDFFDGTKITFMISTNDGILTDRTHSFYPIHDKSFLSFLKIQLPLILNQAIMNRNNNKTVNSEGFGKAVFVNQSTNILRIL